jgi:hypothetical protein
MEFFYFLVFAAISTITTTTNPTRKKAHHMPALKIVSMAPQLLKTKRVKNSANKKGDNFISKIFYNSKKFNYYTSLIFLFKAEKIRGRKKKELFCFNNLVITEYHFFF